MDCAEYLDLTWAGEKENVGLYILNGTLRDRHVILQMKYYVVNPTVAHRVHIVHTYRNQDETRLMQPNP